MRRRVLSEVILTQRERLELRSARISEIARKVDEIEHDSKTLPEGSTVADARRERFSRLVTGAREAIAEATAAMANDDARGFETLLAESFRYAEAARAIYQDVLVGQREQARLYGKRGGRGRTADGLRTEGHPYAEDWSRLVDEAIAKNPRLSRTDAYKHVAWVWIDELHQARNWTTIRDAVAKHNKKPK
jgi:hypothetical protein